MANGGPVPGAGSPTSTPTSGDTPSTPPYPAEAWLEAHRNIGLVRKVIGRFGVQPDSSAIDYEELVAAGLEGAARGLASWDPARGAAKLTWLWSRIHGAVLDEMRRQGSARGWSRKRGRVYELLSLERLLEGYLEFDSKPPPMPEELVEEAFEYEDEGPAFEDLVLHLGERDRVIVELRFRDCLPLAEIGRRFGVSESRICQIVNRICDRLRTELEEAS